MTLRQLAGGKLRRSEEGQDLLEYGLLMALIAIFAMGAVSMVGKTITNVFWYGDCQQVSNVAFAALSSGAARRDGDRPQGRVASRTR